MKQKFMNNTRSIKPRECVRQNCPNHRPPEWIQIWQILSCWNVELAMRHATGTYVYFLMGATPYEVHCSAACCEGLQSQACFLRILTVPVSTTLLFVASYQATASAQHSEAFEWANIKIFCEGTIDNFNFLQGWYKQPYRNVSKLSVLFFCWCLSTLTSFGTKFRDRIVQFQVKMRLYELYLNALFSWGFCWDERKQCIVLKRIIEISHRSQTRVLICSARQGAAILARNHPAHRTVLTYMCAILYATRRLTSTVGARNDSGTTQLKPVSIIMRK